MLFYSNGKREDKTVNLTQTISKHTVYAECAFVDFTCNMQEYSDTKKIYLYIIYLHIVDLHCAMDLYYWHLK